MTPVAFSGILAAAAIGSSVICDTGRMSTNYVLVDFENLQPDMSALAGTDHKVVVFFGAKQQTSRHHFDKFDSLFALGANLVREKILHSGKNALDMHIAYYLGRIFERDPGATVHVISRDTDFDPLLEYLNRQGCKCSREKDIAGVVRSAPSRIAPKKSKAAAQPRRARAAAPPAQKPAAAPKKAPEWIEPFIKQLRSMNGKPSSTRKLGQTLGAYFKHHGGERSARDLERDVQELVQLGFVTVDGTRLKYSLD
jgi:hypothetical protein